MLSILNIHFAEAAVDMTAFGNVVNPIINNIVYPAIQLLFGLTVLIFVYGALQLVFYGSEPSAREKGKLTILWGSIGMFIMVSAWGIIYFISNTVIDLSK
jgi:large-conductance mechanosensitive channel